MRVSFCSNGGTLYLDKTDPCVGYFLKGLAGNEQKIDVSREAGDDHFYAKCLIIKVAQQRLSPNQKLTVVGAPEFVSMSRDPIRDPELLTLLNNKNITYHRK